MSTIPLSVPRPAMPRDDFSALTALSATLSIVFALALGSDPRTLDLAPVWLKPLHFALSFILYFATLALVVRRLSPQVRAGWPLRATTLAIAVAYLAEMGYIAVQAARAERSHFNLSDPVHTALYAAMGVGAVTLVVGVAVIGALVARDADFAAGPRSRQGIVLGFAMTLPLTLIVAGYMSSSGSHWVGTPQPGGATVPLMGWSLTVGDLRPAHFVSIHAMQALPLMGLWLDRRGSTDRRLLWGAAAIWSILCLALFLQALMGLPLIPQGVA